MLVAIRRTARLYPMGSEIDAPTFDNHEGGIGRDLPFRRNLALDASGQMTDTAPAKGHALAGYLASLAALKPTVVLHPVPEAGWMPPRINLPAMVAGGPPPDLISTARSLPAMQRGRDPTVQRCPNTPTPAQPSASLAVQCARYRALRGAGAG